MQIGAMLEHVVEEIVVEVQAKIMLDARRKAGDTLIEMKERGELETKGGDRKSKLEHPTLKLDDLGISKYQASHYQLEARVPEEK